MAGDWIKMRTDLAEDPAVIGIAARVGIDEFAVVGRLHHLWTWFDSQSRDGHAAGVTHSWVDRKVQCAGFAEAMQSVGWLEIDETGITIPNFERHNGKTAKTRALSTNRKQNQRSSVPRSVPDFVSHLSEKTSRNERDICVTREEKRREEKSKSKSAAVAADQIPSDPKAALWAKWKALPDGGGGAFLAKLIRDFHDEQAVLEAVERTLDHAPADPKAFIVGVLRKRDTEPDLRAYGTGQML